MTSLKQTHLRTATAIALIVLTPQLLRAGDTDGDGFNEVMDGQPIYAGELNENFDVADARLQRFEDAIFISDLGDVGIGTSSPGAKLETGATDNNRYAFKFGNALGNSFLTGYVDGDDGQGGVAIGIGYNQTDGPDNGLIVQGNIGIGTSQPQNSLHFGGSRSTNHAIRIDRNDAQRKSFIGHDSTGFYIQTGDVSDDNGDTVSFRRADGAVVLLINSNNGNMGVGTTSPSYRLHVNGTVAGSGAYVNTSDARYKANVQSIGDGLEILSQLRGVRFDWKEVPGLDLPGGRQVGFIAQEVEEVLPEVVSQDSRGYRSIAYGSIVPVLAAAIQEQQTEIEALREMHSEAEAARRQIFQLEEEVVALTAAFTEAESERRSASERLSRLEALLGSGGLPTEASIER